MIRYVIKRVLWMIPVLLGVIILIFTINYLNPSDPVVGILGASYTEEAYNQKVEELGLDKPYIIRLGNYIKGVVTEMDLGTSYTTHRPVKTEIANRIRYSVIIGLLGTLLSVVIAIPLGIVSATHQYSVLDYVVLFFSVFLASTPNFWLALMLMLLFCLKLGLLPAAGVSNWMCFILPVLCVSVGPIASITRMTRSSMLEVIRQDYIRTARAKGVPEKVIVRKHALKNALIPVVTVVGMQLGHIMGGSILVETIFSIPGLGILMSTGITSNDHPVIQGCVLVISCLVCSMNLLTDIVYGFIDPRIMAQYTRGKSDKKRRAKADAAEERGAAV